VEVIGIKNIIINYYKEILYMKYNLGIYLIEINFIYKYFFYSLKLALKLFKKIKIKIIIIFYI